MKRLSIFILLTAFCILNSYADKSDNTPIQQTDKSVVNNRLVRRYNSDGKVIEEQKHKANGALSWRHTYKYDANGNVIESFRYKGNRELSWAIFYKYDSKGNMIESTHFLGDGTLDKKIAYEYDAEGNKTNETEYRNVSTSAQFTLTDYSRQDH